MSVTVASLDQLILLAHDHGQRCPLTPSLQPDLHRQEVKQRLLEEDLGTSIRSSKADEVELCLTYVCEGGHAFTWRPIHTEADDNGEKSKEGSAAPSGQRKIREGQRKRVKREKVCTMRSRRSARGKPVSDLNPAGLGQRDETERVAPAASGENEEAGITQDI